MVLFEDSAALAGLLVAFLAIFLEDLTGIVYLDGAGSILIGLILAGVASLLAIESRGLMLGEAVDPQTQASIRRLTEADPAVVRIRRPMTMHFGPDVVLLALEVQFREGLSAREIEEAVDRLEATIRAAHPQIKHIFLEAESIRPRALRGTAEGT
jgi:divalent metal cation (Fe/Co/Zn/Cd) transporter